MSKSNRITFVIIALLFGHLANAQEQPEIGEMYRLADSKGNSLKFSDVINQAKKADVILFGELHNATVAHYLQLALLKALIATQSNIAVGFEMLEADNKLLISELETGKISANNFNSQARLWPNWKQDYKPVFDLALAAKCPIIASNVPRRYASIVSRQGLEGLSTLDTEAKKYFPPLPITVDFTLPGYKMLVGGMSNSTHGTDGTLPNTNMAAAQALKDATMAYNILDYTAKGKKVYHLNGSYHSNNREGIVYYLLAAKPSLKILTINTIILDNNIEGNQSAKEKKANALDQLKAADITLILPEDSPLSSVGE